VTHGDAPSSSSRAATANETCALSDLLLKHPDEIFATYVETMKHLKYTLETCVYSPSTYATSRSTFATSK
jgi:hypothetical protein